MPNAPALPAMMRWRPLVLLLSCLTGCSAFTSFEAAAPTEGQYSVCYSTLYGSPEQVRAFAAQECGSATPRLVQQSLDLSQCPVLTPMRAIYACRKPPSRPTP